MNIQINLLNKFTRSTWTGVKCRAHHEAEVVHIITHIITYYVLHNLTSLTHVFSCRIDCNYFQLGISQWQRKMALLPILPSSTYPENLLNEIRRCFLFLATVELDCSLFCGWIRGNWFVSDMIGGEQGMVSTTYNITYYVSFIRWT